MNQDIAERLEAISKLLQQGKGGRRSSKRSKRRSPSPYSSDTGGTGSLEATPLSSPHVSTALSAASAASVAAATEVGRSSMLWTIIKYIAFGFMAVMAGYVIWRFIKSRRNTSAAMPNPTGPPTPPAAAAAPTAQAQAIQQRMQQRAAAMRIPPGEDPQAQPNAAPPAPATQQRVRSLQEIRALREQRVAERAKIEEIHDEDEKKQVEAAVAEVSEELPALVDDEEEESEAAVEHMDVEDE